ncbi:transglutaminase family protein [Thermococcus sp.]|uniref:transglutaminase-like domain-containing protein n=1 Tax=Thermococcus sp. TaxID=35749 RepID=UPI0019CD2E59|nr:transglutaminase family protein [Thermococcus sp.]MBC7095455.1 transglutaminase family protein [Thermococcus sp.]
MKDTTTKLTLAVLLLILATPVSALTVPIGTLETKYIILSESQFMNPGPTVNYATFMSKMYSSVVENKYEVNLTNYTVKYAIYRGKRKIIWGPPANSSKFVPRYNNSIYLPEDLKKIVEEFANSSETIAEFVWKVSWFVHKTIAYEDVFYITELGRVIFNENETNWLIKEVWEKKKGVCRHKAILTQQMIRYAGVEAEYVGGYVLIPVNGSHKYLNPLEIDTIPELVQFSTHTGLGHAWIIVNDPAVGWYPIDPTRQKKPLKPHNA